MITRENRSNLPLHYIFLEDTKYMTILTRQERERLVLELYYNQGKTYREISKQARISPRDIGVILNKALEEKTQGKEEQGDAEKNREQQQDLSLPPKPTNSFLIERLHQKQRLL